MGIFSFMAVESFFHFQAKVVMVPAGILVQKNEMNSVIIIFCDGAESLVNILVNYPLALKVGRKLLLKYSKSVGIKNKKIIKVTLFFKIWLRCHFFARFVPLIRQYISIPASISRMGLMGFCLFTFLGASLWNAFLMGLGYFWKK